MNKTKTKTSEIMFLVIVSCVIMAIVETVIEPPYAVKSALKAALFLLLPLIYLKAKGERLSRGSRTPDKRRAAGLLALGLTIYAVIMAAYMLTKNIFDYPTLVGSLSADQNVSPGSFIWVAGYISFGNSFLEEFMFRSVAFIKLSEHTGKRAAYIFSSVMFAVYHIAMIGASFPAPMIIIAIIGLAAGGAVFDCLDDRDGSIYSSWVIHMFADLAIMTVWYIHI